MQAVRLWLRRLGCTNRVENELRRRLRTRFDCTLPRFDVLAQLDKEPHGLPLGELSRRMMVSDGNVTGLVERLTADGLIESRVSEHDRRSTTISPTEAGHAAFDAMTAAHAEWVAELVAVCRGRMATTSPRCFGA